MADKYVNHWTHNYEPPPHAPQPEWGYTTIDGSPVPGMSQPASLFDRSLRSNLWRDDTGWTNNILRSQMNEMGGVPGSGPQFRSLPPDPFTLPPPPPEKPRSDPPPKPGMMNMLLRQQMNQMGGMPGPGPVSPSSSPGGVVGKEVPPPAAADARLRSGFKSAPPMSLPGGSFDRVSMPSPLARPTTPGPLPQEIGYAQAAIPPMMLTRAQIPQTPRGSGPGAPIPVPFTSGEVRAAARLMLTYTPAPWPTRPGGPLWVVAEKTAEVLQRWGSSRGWVRIRPSVHGGSPKTFNLADKVSDIARGGESRLSGLGADRPPAGVVPLDLESATTTWDTEQFRTPEQDAPAAPAWFGPAPSIAGDGPGGNPVPPAYGGVRPMPIGPGVQVTGARANLGALAGDAVGAAFAAGPGSFGPAPGPDAFAGAIDFFPLLQAHPIRQKKERV